MHCFVRHPAQRAVPAAFQDDTSDSGLFKLWFADKTRMRSYESDVIRFFLTLDSGKYYRLLSQLSADWQTCVISAKIYDVSANKEFDNLMKDNTAICSGICGDDVLRVYLCVPLPHGKFQIS